MTASSRRFPAPWHADKIPGGYVVRDATGQALAYLQGRETEACARQAKVSTNDEARRIAVDVARLPELLGKVGDWDEPAEHPSPIAVTDPAPGSFLPLIEPTAFGSGSWDDDPHAAVL
jgi:hypothetical protein